VREKEERKMDGKDFVKAFIVAVLVYVVAAFVGGFLGISIFPDASLGIAVLLEKMLFAGFFIIISIIVIATAPLYLKS